MNENEDFGSYLKHERELRGVALEDIADQTKIHLKYLEALENNLYDNLPGEVFVKGYIRSYAKTIGSNVEEIINTYDDSVGRERRKVLESAQSEQCQKKSLLKPIVGLTGFLAVLAGLVYGGMYFADRAQDNPPLATPAPGLPPAAPSAETGSAALVPEEKQPADEKNIAEIPAPESAAKPADKVEKSGDFSKNFGDPKAAESVPKAPVAPPVKPSPELAESKKVSTEDQKEVIIQSVAVSSNAGNNSLPSETEGETESELVLKIQAQENSWFNLTVDDYREEDFILPGGLAKTFSGKEKFRITIGNKNNTQLYLNGQPLMLPEVPGEVVRDFIINASLLE
ncbi:MAG: helix-turn-helix domain-containing protein [Nitrospinaceae bacterium]|nr:MAG: helix-turn-helix domain-containing protein [Nitrospinaceae bacterium]